MITARHVVRIRASLLTARHSAGAFLAPRALLHASVLVAAKPKAGKGGAASSGGGSASSPAGTPAGFAGVDVPALKAEMAKSLDWAKRELSKLRGGTATPRESRFQRVLHDGHGTSSLQILALLSSRQLFVLAEMLDHVMVEVEGEKMPLASVGQVSLKNPTQFVVAPYDTAVSVAHLVGTNQRDDPRAPFSATPLQSAETAGCVAAWPYQRPFTAIFTRLVAQLLHVFGTNRARGVQHLAAITKAITDAGLNLNPSHDDKIVKVPVPKPSKESRDANIKVVGKIALDAKETIRRVRQDTLDKLKKVDGACIRLCCRAHLALPCGLLPLHVHGPTCR